MNIEILKQLEMLSKAVGIPIEYTQGGGGNTSAKLDDTQMAVKASGFQLKQITANEGFVVVNYKNVIDYYGKVDLSKDIDYEKDSADFMKTQVLDIEGLKKLRPSVEAGFHSILKKYVIHTHPVYANIVTCSVEGEGLLGKIFKDKPYACLWIPYINPGFCLTVKIKEGIEACIKKSGKFPEVIFMENHGLIVTKDDSTECVALHKEVNDTIREYFGLIDEYPQVIMNEAGENKFISNTAYLKEYFKGSQIKNTFFDDYVLYPDQLVYLNGSAGINTDGDKKLNINTKTGEIIYNTNQGEARTIEETLLAYIFVLNGVKRCGLTLKTMTDKDISFIRNWESEAYRKSLVSQLGN